LNRGLHGGERVTSFSSRNPPDLSRGNPDENEVCRETLAALDPFSGIEGAK
jgi:hypothetical protein